MQFTDSKTIEIRLDLDRRLREDLFFENVEYTVYFIELVSKNEIELNDDDLIKKLNKTSLASRLANTSSTIDENTILISLENDLVSSAIKSKKLKNEVRPISLSPMTCDKSMVSEGLLDVFLGSKLSGCTQKNPTDIPPKSKRNYLNIFVEVEKSCNFFN